MASNYNSRFRPAEVFVYNGIDYLVRKRETFEDLMLNQIEVDVMPGADKLELPELATLDLAQKGLKK